MNQVTRGALLLLTALPCFAHHSFAMFDRTHTLMLQGTVRQFQWTNPHCFLQLLVEKEGPPVEWSLETSSPADMYRIGWRPGSFRPGDKVTVVINPSRDGMTSGSVVSATDAHGRSYLTVKRRK
jgi:hypothetical protein